MSIIYGRKKPANPFILTASTELTPIMSERRQEHQIETGGDGDGRVHRENESERFVEYPLLSRLFLTFPSSIPASSSFFHLRPTDSLVMSGFHSFSCLASFLSLDR